MPSGRAVLLIRRLSTGDNRLMNLGINQNSKEQLLPNTICFHRELGVIKRLSSFGHSYLTQQQTTRNFSDNIIKMATPSTDSSSSSQNKIHKHTNKLINEKSPYLLQHAHNPVDWYPWGQEAIDKARNEHKPIFLSIGYSTCHWCHVMEKESFENEDIAEIMNKHFVNIKVDREERPDIDKIYMLFVMATTQSGGWPLSVFLTPDLIPVTGGTYFPPENRWGKPGFKKVLLTLAKKWKENNQEFSEAGTSIMEALQKISKIDSDSSLPVPGEDIWEKCVDKYIDSYEPEFGGFGTAPKFPQPSIFNFLFHYYARDKSNPTGKKCLDMCLYTLSKIAKGGIHDHVGGGFARYSTDNEWHVPHFEKMLYDQAQLVVAYTDAYVETKDKFYSDVVDGIIKYVNRDLRHESGGYYSAEDADSYPTKDAIHKKEGAFYVWEFSEIKSLLRRKRVNDMPYLDVFCEYFHVEEDGNVSPESDPHGELENKNILISYASKAKIAEELEISVEELDTIISNSLKILYEARQERPRPHLDDKILCSWNGLMIAALARAGQGLNEKSYIENAILTAEFIKKYLYDPTTYSLIHSCYKNEVGSISQVEQPIKGFLDDYAFLIKGLLDLYEASLDSSWLNWARELQMKQNELFWDFENGGYFNCVADDPTVVLRFKEDNDGAEPSGNSVSCHNLQRLGAYNDKTSAPEGGDNEREMARKLLVAFSKRLTETPSALPEMMSALMFYNDTPTQVLIAGGRSDPRTLELIRVVRSRLLPGRVLAVADPSADAPAVLNRIFKATGDVPKAYVCRRYACSLPVSEVKQLEDLLDSPPPVVIPKKHYK